MNVTSPVPFSETELDQICLVQLVIVTVVVIGNRIRGGGTRPDFQGLGVKETWEETEKLNGCEVNGC